MTGLAWVGLALAAALAYALGYWLLWDVATRLSPATLRRAAAGEGKVALTFDDGPGEVTPRLLDALAALGVRATFFVVWERVRGREELLSRMRREGHEVALHGMRHVHAGLTPPWRAARDLERAAAALAEATGGAALPFFRPPWGSANALQLAACRRRGLRVVLWAVDARDYRADATPSAIARQVVGRVRDGDIVDMHDAGGAAGAPERTLAALPDVVAGLRQRRLEPVTLSELLRAGEEPTSALLRLWEVWEGLFARMEAAVPVGREGLIAISLRTYRGPALTTGDGRLLGPGTPAGEIHLGNYAVSRLAGGPRELLRLRRMLNEAVDDLAAAVARGEFASARLFFGTTLLGRAAAQVGLHAREVAPTPGVRLNVAWMRLLMRIYHPDGAARLRRHPEGLRPMLCWITREELLARHAARTAAQAEPGAP